MANTKHFEATVQLDSGLIIPASAALGATLQSDATGVAAWQPSGTARKNMRVPELAAATAVSTANVASLEGLPTVDGVVMEAEQIVLLTAQTTKSQNGPWVVAVGAWTRPLDFATGWELKSARNILVLKGTNNKQTVWFLNYTEAVIIGTTNQEWVRTLGKVGPIIGKAGGTTEAEEREFAKAYENTAANAIMLYAYVQLAALKFNINIQVVLEASTIYNVIVKGPGTVQDALPFEFIVPSGAKYEVKCLITEGESSPVGKYKTWQQALPF